MRPCRNGGIGLVHIVAVQIIIKFGKGRWLMPTIGNGLYDLAFGKYLLVKRHAFYSVSFVLFQASVTNREAQCLTASTLR
jgi:hypothetical protein